MAGGGGGGGGEGGGRRRGGGWGGCTGQFRCVGVKVKGVRQCPDRSTARFAVKRVSLNNAFWV